MELKPTFDQPSLPITGDFDNSKKSPDIGPDNEILEKLLDQAMNPEPNIEIRLKNLQELSSGLQDLLINEVNEFDSNLLSQERKEDLIKSLKENSSLKLSLTKPPP